MKYIHFQLQFTLIAIKHILHPLFFVKKYVFSLIKSSHNLFDASTEREVT